MEVDSWISGAPRGGGAIPWIVMAGAALLGASPRGGKFFHGRDGFASDWQAHRGAVLASCVFAGDQRDDFDPRARPRGVLGQSLANPSRHEKIFRPAGDAPSSAAPHTITESSPTSRRPLIQLSPHQLSYTLLANICPCGRIADMENAGTAQVRFSGPRQPRTVRVEARRRTTPPTRRPARHGHVQRWRHARHRILLGGIRFGSTQIIVWSHLGTPSPCSSASTPCIASNTAGFFLRARMLLTSSSTGSSAWSPSSATPPTASKPTSATQTPRPPFEQGIQAKTDHPELIIHPCRLGHISR